ncbi:ankyrin repeat-containing domain protein [Aspergillus karnatakaensis]|uniref:ankyrin repeat-containing domain protein n=1 Tax=Aspergillus karnatakaensis TaxID=1810916 RepID=UPI003CCD37B2
MSFGFGVGDFLAAFKIANELRKRFVNAPGEFNALAEHVKQLSSVLRDIDDIDPTDELDDRQKQRLNEISQQCGYALKELQGLLDKHQEIDGSDGSTKGRSKRVWKRLKWDAAAAEAVQGQIQSHINAFTLFLSGLNVQMNISQRETIKSVQQMQQDEKTEEVLNWLSDLDFGAKQTDYLRRRQPGTSQWILEAPEFKSWIDKPGQTLFCHGIPGAGKTIMTATVIEYLNERYADTPNTGIAYIYFNFREQNKPEELLMSILMQLSRQRGALSESVKELFAKHKGAKTRPSWTDISKAQKAVMGSFSSLFIVIDALDECSEAEGCRRRILSELFRLQEGTAMHLFFTSRPNPDILESFAGKTHLEIQANKDDIQVYIEGHIEMLPRSVQRSQELQLEIKTTVSDNVAGMFLLAQLYVQALQDKVTPRDIRNTLQQFKAQSSKPAHDQKSQILATAYSNTMDRINQLPHSRQQLAKNVLLWLTCARFPLTTTQIQAALALNDGDTEVDKENIPDVQDMLGVCTGLVTVDEETKIMRLVHYTTQEYFERTWETWFPDAHFRIAATCLTHLMLDVFDAGPCKTHAGYKARIQEYPLYIYAAKSWGYHYHKQQNDDEMVLEFLSSEPKLAAATQAMEAENPPPDLFQSTETFLMEYSPVHLAARYGLVSIFKKLVKNGQVVEKKDKTLTTPLIWAARKGHVAAMQLLLDFGADSNSQDGEGQTPLMNAACNGRTEAIEYLLSRTADINRKDRFWGRTALIWAVCGNYEAAAKLLLESGADPNIPDDCCRAALGYAARLGNVALVRLLLQRNGDVHLRDDMGETPVIGALINGQDETVKLLLESNSCPQDNVRTLIPLVPAVMTENIEMVKFLLGKGADPNVSLTLSDDSDTVRSFGSLAFACICGNMELVRLLLNHGANPMETGGPQESPLIAAAGAGHEPIVRLLLDNGVESHADALAYAAGNGYVSIAGLLLQHGAQVNSPGKAFNETYKTPLLWAACHDHTDIIRMLLSHGADASSVDLSAKDGGRTAFSFSAQAGNTTAMELLFNNGGNVDSPDNLGRTPLMYAAAGGHTEAVSMLIRLGADPNACGYCVTPLSNAAAIGNTTLMRILCDSGADPNLQSCGISPLRRAAVCGSVAAIKLLLELGANLDENFMYQESPFALALLGGHEACSEIFLERNANSEMALDCAVLGGLKGIVEKLLKRRADPNIPLPALASAASSGRLDLAQLLLEHGADPNLADPDKDRILGRYHSPKGVKPVPILVAASKGHLDIVELLLEQGVNPDSEATGHIFNMSGISCTQGQTALSVAAASGHVYICKLLLERRANPNSRDSNGWTPLMHAAQGGYPDTMRTLLVHGADPQYVNERGVTPLMAACSSTGAMLALLELGVPIDQQDNLGQTALWHAASRQDKVSIRFLTEHGANPAMADRTGQTPLLAAARSQWRYPNISPHPALRESIRALLAAGADRNTTNTVGQTTLMCGAMKGNVELVRLMLAADVNISVKDYRNCTAMGYAVEYGHMDIVKMLLEHEHDESAPGIHITDSAVFIAVVHGHIDMVKSLRPILASTTAMREFLMRLGPVVVTEIAVPSRPPEASETWNSWEEQFLHTMLLWASQEGYLDLVEALLARPEVKPNGLNWPRIKTPLELAVEGRHESIVKLLLSHDASPRRALRLISSKGYLPHEVIDSLLTSQKHQPRPFTELPSSFPKNPLPPEEPSLIRSTTFGSELEAIPRSGQRSASNYGLLRIGTW